MISAFALVLLASCLSVSEYVCNSNVPIVNQLCCLVVQLRQALRLDPPDHNRHCRRAAEKSRKRHRVTFGSQQAQCLCPRKAPTSQEPARKPIRAAVTTGSRRPAQGSSGIDIAPNDGTAKGFKHPWIVVGDLLVAVVLLAVTHTHGTKLRTTGQLSGACIIAACHFAQLLVISDQHLGYFKTCAPSQNQSRPANPPSSPASKRKGVGKSQATGNKGQPRKSNKQNNPEPATGQSSSDVEDGNVILWACPFHKLDPDTYRPCGGLTLSNWSAVLQHIKRSHLLREFYCPTCWLFFSGPDSQEQYDNHTRNATCVAVLGPERFEVEEANVIFNARLRGKNPEEKWFWLWDTFFKGHPRPRSPYVENALEQAALVLDRPLVRESLDTLLQDRQRTGQAISADNIREFLSLVGTQVGRPLRLHPSVRSDAMPPGIQASVPVHADELSAAENRNTRMYIAVPSPIEDFNLMAYSSSLPQPENPQNLSSREDMDDSNFIDAANNFEEQITQDFDFNEFLRGLR